MLLDASSRLRVIALSAALAAVIVPVACSSDESPPPEPPDEAGIPPEASLPDSSLTVLEAEAPVFDANLPGSVTQISETDLYQDVAAKKISPFAVEFVPAHALWSDGADKRRFLVLPPGTKIDTSDMDHWRFPVGTRFYKEFSRDGKRLETRLIWLRADTGAESDFFVGAFVWRDDESDADLAPDGKDGVRGTDHEVPSQTRCITCHGGEPGRILGFSAIQLSKPGPGTNLEDLAAQGFLTNPPSGGVDHPVPGTASEQAALGLLHANCGHCHNPNGTAWPDTQMVLRLKVSETAPDTCEVYTTTVGQALTRYVNPDAGLTLRIAAGQPDASAIVHRMAVRTFGDQMPPIATKHVDDAGVAAVSSWISGL